MDLVANFSGSYDTIVFSGRLSLEGRAKPDLLLAVYLSPVHQRDHSKVIEVCLTFQG